MLAPSGSCFSEEWVCFSLSRVKRPDRWLVSLCDEGAVDLLVWFHVFTQVHENSSVLCRCFNQTFYQVPFGVSASVSRSESDDVFVFIGL